MPTAFRARKGGGSGGAWGAKEFGSRLLSRQAIGVKDDHLRCILMCIDGPQSVAVSTSVGGGFRDYSKRLLV